MPDRTTTVSFVLGSILTGAIAVGGTLGAVYYQPTLAAYITHTTEIKGVRADYAKALASIVDLQKAQIEHDAKLAEHDQRFGDLTNDLATNAAAVKSHAGTLATLQQANIGVSGQFDSVLVKIHSLENRPVPTPPAPAPNPAPAPPPAPAPTPQNPLGISLVTRLQSQPNDFVAVGNMIRAGTLATRNAIVVEMTTRAKPMSATTEATIAAHSDATGKITDPTGLAAEFISAGTAAGGK